MTACATRAPMAARHASRSDEPRPHCPSGRAGCHRAGFVPPRLPRLRSLARRRCGPAGALRGGGASGQAPEMAALEMAGTGGTFEATEDMRIALTGAPMRAHLDGAPLAWNASHPLPAGGRLTIGQ